MDRGRPCYVWYDQCYLVFIIKKCQVICVCLYVHTVAVGWSGMQGLIYTNVLSCLYCITHTFSLSQCTYSTVWSRVERFVSGFNSKNTGEVSRMGERENVLEFPGIIVHFLCFDFNTPSVSAVWNLLHIYSSTNQCIHDWYYCWFMTFHNINEFQYLCPVNF